MSIYNILVAENLLRIDELFKFLNYYHSMKKRMSHIVINCQIDISVVIFLIVEKNVRC